MAVRPLPMASASPLVGRGLGRPSLSVILTWPPPNRIDPVTKTWLIPYSCIFLVLSTILLVARFWSRYKKQSGGFGLDDLIIFPAWIFGVINTALIIVAIKNGIGMHVWDIPIGKGTEVALMGWLSEGCFLITTGLTKISILLFYRRLSAGSYNRTWEYCTKTAIAFVVLYIVVFLQVLVFVCIPTEAFWRQYDLSYGSNFKCMDGQVPSVLAGTFSVFTDLYSVLLPCWLFWTLQIPRGQKIALWGVFAVGFLTVGCGIARTFYLDKMATTFNADVTWVSYDVMLWSVNEANLAFICASLPALRSFFTRYLFPSAGRAITSAKSASRKLARVANPRRAENGFRSLHTEASQIMVPSDGDVRDEKGNIDWNQFGRYDSAKGCRVEAMMQKVNGVGNAVPPAARGISAPYSTRTAVPPPGEVVVAGRFPIGEADGLSDVYEKGQHNRQLSSGSNKPLPQLPGNTYGAD